nr:hypothetical protein CFP56_06136 [Quercus suber]
MAASLSSPSLIASSSAMVSTSFRANPPPASASTKWLNPSDQSSSPSSPSPSQPLLPSLAILPLADSSLLSLQVVGRSGFGWAGSIVGLKRGSDVFLSVGLTLHPPPPPPMVESFRSVIVALLSLPIPTIAAIYGHFATSGLVLALVAGGG